MYPLLTPNNRFVLALDITWIMMIHHHHHNHHLNYFNPTARPSVQQTNPLTTFLIPLPSMSLLLLLLLMMLFLVDIIDIDVVIAVMKCTLLPFLSRRRRRLWWWWILWKHAYICLFNRLLDCLYIHLWYDGGTTTHLLLGICKLLLRRRWQSKIRATTELLHSTPTI